MGVSLEIILGKLRDVREYHGPCSTRVPSRKEQLVVGATLSIVTNPSNSSVFWCDNFKFHTNPRKTIVNVAIRKNSTLFSRFYLHPLWFGDQMLPGYPPEVQRIAPFRSYQNPTGIRSFPFPPFFGDVKLRGCFLGAMESYFVGFICTSQDSTFRVPAGTSGDMKPVEENPGLEAFLVGVFFHQADVGNFDI